MTVINNLIKKGTLADSSSSSVVESEAVDINDVIQESESIIVSIKSCPSNADVGEEVVVKADTVSGAMYYIWNFDDGYTKMGMTASHVYREAGEYNIVLTVKDAWHNVIGTCGKTIVISKSPGKSTFTSESVGSYTSLLVN